MQTNLFKTGAQLRDEGIARAERNAGQGWADAAFNLFVQSFLPVNAQFKAEDFRNYAKGLLPEPKSLRAFGGVMVRAKMRGLIKSIGTTKVNNPKAHMANASVWKRL